MASLYCYKIRREVGGRPVRDFDEVVDLEDRSARAYGPVQGDGFEAKLFVTEGHPRPPDWLGLLQEGFGAGVSVPKTRSAGALLVLKITYQHRDHFVAFTFGLSGRFLLKAGSWERSFGMKTALNLIYEGDDGSAEFDASRLRSVDFKRVASNTVRLREQANRRTSLETFDFDIKRDLLYKVFGPPVDTNTWGGRVGGADALSLTSDVSFSGLGNLCKQMLRARARDDYRKRFSWVDNIRAIEDEDEVRQLEDEVVQRLRRGEIENIQIAAPDLLDWERVRGFQFPEDRRKRPKDKKERAVRFDPELSEYLSQLGDDRSTIEADMLRRHDLRAVDGDGQLVGRWRIWDCLTAELALDDRSFILDEGTFYEVAQSYQDEVNRFLDDISEWDRDLLPARKGVSEAHYNRTAAESSSDYLLLDKELVRAPGTTSIEVCDLLVADGTLVHVKKGFGSSTLSHLFSQGAVSAELLLEREFREAAVSKIADVSRKLAGDGGGWVDEHEVFVADRLPDPRRHRVVFAIIGPWNGTALQEKLPFFSKVNLRANVHRLERLGFPVSHKRIPLGVS